MDFATKIDQGLCLDCHEVLPHHRRRMELFLHLCSNCLTKRDDTLYNILCPSGSPPPIEEVVKELVSGIVTIVSEDDCALPSETSEVSEETLSASPSASIIPVEPVKRKRGRPPGSKKVTG